MDCEIGCYRISPTRKTARSEILQNRSFRILNLNEYTPVSRTAARVASFATRSFGIC